MEDVSIAYRCRDNSHPHYKKSKVEDMVAKGQLVWVGNHKRIARYLDPMAWAKVESEGFQVMQLVRGLRR
jgi:hypothetical protein